MQAERMDQMAKRPMNKIALLVLVIVTALTLDSVVRNADATTERPTLSTTTPTVTLARSDSSENTSADSATLCSWKPGSRTYEVWSPVHDYVSNPNFPPVLVGYKIKVYREWVSSICPTSQWRYWYTTYYWL